MCGTMARVSPPREAGAAEEALREREAFIAAITDSARALIIVLDLTTGRVVYANAYVEDLLGYRPEELYAMGPEALLNLAHPEDAGAVAGLLEACRQAPDGARQSLEFRDRRKNGEYRWVRANGTPFGPRDATGAATQVLYVVDDVHEAKLAEAALREREERYRTLFNSVDEGFCVVDVLFDEAGEPVDYRFLEMNPAFERHTGLRGAAGKRARELVPDLEAHWFEIYGRVAATGEPARFVNEAKAMDDRWFEVEALRLGGEESRRVAIIFTDISARKRAEEDRARLAAIVASSRDAILGCALDGTITAWNRGAEELFGYSAEESVGRHVAHLIPADHADELPRLFDRLRRDEAIPPAETVWVRKDGSRIDVEMALSPIPDAVGGVGGVAAVVRDATARRRLERAQQDFIAMASHDLRTPITVLRARAQLMRRHKAYDEEGLAAIVEQTRRMERLVADLREVVRLEAGGVELRRRPVDLRQLAREATARARAETAGHALNVEVPNAPVVGAWDRDRLGQVLDNLLGNAVKYSPAGGEIVVRVAAVDGEARLSVEDRGHGVPAEALPRLFDRFYRVDQSGSPSGLGLGLYIARMLVETHEGRIWAESAPGMGSTFTVALPQTA
jgi:PAS domain S-box-containing protein